MTEGTRQSIKTDAHRAEQISLVVVDDGVTLQVPSGVISIAATVVKGNTNVTAIGSGSYEYTIAVGYSKEAGFIPDVDRYVSIV